MDQIRVQQFLETNWDCELLTSDDLRRVLGATDEEVEAILFAVTGGLWQKVYSFEIRQFIIDKPSPAPEILELTPPMSFLLRERWEIDSRYKVYRFYRKDQPLSRTSLRIALDVERAAEDLFRMQDSNDASEDNFPEIRQLDDIGEVDSNTIVR